MRPLIAATLAATVLAVPAAQARETERECEAGQEDVVSLDAEYETWQSAGKTRRSFSVEVDMERTRGFKAGQLVTFTVAGRVVATRPLVRERDGDLSAEIDFRSWRAGSSAFPKNFPAVKTGTAVAASIDGRKSLRCRLS